VTAKLRSTLVTQLHGEAIEAHTIRKANWTKSVFHKVQWDAHERAFRRLPRYTRYSTAKMIHSLVNTNRQNALYYGQSSFCPICNQEEETLLHVFTCPHPTAQLQRHQSLENLTKNLSSISTPIPVIDAIVHGFTQWNLDPNNYQIRSLTAGSLRGPDAVLTTAFYEQVKDIGWFHLCLGKVSTKWASAVCQYNVNPLPQVGLQWSSLMIAAMWRYSRSLWHHRNGVVHGAMIEEQVQRHLSNLRDQITQYYAEFAENPSLVLARPKNLFTSRTKEERLNTSYNAMAAWIRSVKEALQVIHHHDTRLGEVSRNFFGVANHPENGTDSDSTYSISSRKTSVDTLSLDPTVATTATFNTMSSAASPANSSYYIQYADDDSSVSTTATADSSSSIATTHSEDQIADRLLEVDQPQDSGGRVCFSTSDYSSDDWDVH
jgi:hypothetical protein